MANTYKNAIRLTIIAVLIPKVPPTEPTRNPMTAPPDDGRAKDAGYCTVISIKALYRCTEDRGKRGTGKITCHHKSNEGNLRRSDNRNKNTMHVAALWKMKIVRGRINLII